MQEAARGRAGQKNPRTENRTEVTENRYRRNQNRRSSVPVRFHDTRNRSSSGYSVLGLGSPEEPKFYVGAVLVLAELLSWCCTEFYVMLAELL